MRGLALLETVDLHGPITVTELSRRTGVDKSIVSRNLAACERDGWIVRNDGHVTLGPRAALLAHRSSTATLIREAEPLVEAISGVTGCLVQACTLAGRSALVIAAAGPSPLASATGLGAEFPLYATAAGQIIAAQLDAAALDALLPADPFPDPLEAMLSLPVFAAIASTLTERSGEAMRTTAVMPRTRRELDEQLTDVRAEGACADRGDIHPALACLSIPWPHATTPAALACLTSPADLHAREQTIRTVLTAAAAPAATRTEVAAAAALAGAAP
jgi:DNA-binding IclR family transcriptional regulator